MESAQGEGYYNPHHVGRYNRIPLFRRPMNGDFIQFTKSDHEQLSDKGIEFDLLGIDCCLCGEGIKREINFQDENRIRCPNHNI